MDADRVLISTRSSTLIDDDVVTTRNSTSTMNTLLGFSRRVSTTSEPVIAQAPYDSRRRSCVPSTCCSTHTEAARHPVCCASSNKALASSRTKSCESEATRVSRRQTQSTPSSMLRKRTSIRTGPGTTRSCVVEEPDGNQRSRSPSVLWTY